jgi:putative membrane-bound dehydrogenase-like protein
MNRAACLCLPVFLVTLACIALPPRSGALDDRAKPGRDDAPRAADPRLVVEKFAAAPDIVHPIGMDFDHRGRLLVIESHTHFPPKGYKGLKHDRIVAIERAAGKAGRFTTFFEGTRATMDIAVHPLTGDVYLATRNEVLRLRDSKGTGKADVRERLVFLDTKGDYPHNGLSGLCFDSRGDLLFGMGENLGASYTLRGADGVTLRGEGEGGNIFHCSADGKNLRLFATGFWNPFGVCRDVRGRLFAVDNDPDSMPPCRLLHVVAGADFGYQFRYGRAGRHPFQCWNGQLPGTLPMVCGTGEAPCEVISYESDGLPRDYLGDLLVAAWADHRIERYVPRGKGASFVAERRPFVQGGGEFRPVGIAVAPDGSLFVSDWVRRDYELHGQGAIWHVRARNATKPDRPREPRQALFSLHRPLRESAARTLAATEAGREFLRKHLTHDELRVRAACLNALIDQDDRRTDLAGFVEKEADPGLRALAVRGLIARGEDGRGYLQAKYPSAVRLEAVAALAAGKDAPRLLALLSDADPYLRHAAIHRLTTNAQALAVLQREQLADARQRRGLLLALRGSGQKEAARHIRTFLADADEEVRFLAVKWVADEKLVEQRPLVVEAMKDRTLNVRMVTALATALARLDGRGVDERQLADAFLARLLDESAPADQRRRALQLVPATHRGLTLGVLTKLLSASDTALQQEAVQALAEHPSPKRGAILRGVARNDRLDEAVRAWAVVALAEQSGEMTDELLALARGKSAVLRDEALRSLVGTRLTPAQQAQLRDLAGKEKATADLVARVLGQPAHAGRPAKRDLDAWQKRLQGRADTAAGRRVFFHAKLAGCFRCHRADGRGQDVGPDLSTIGQRERRFILESILQPSNDVAPHYQAWSITTEDGRTRTGMLVNTNLDEYTYIDEKGKPFKVNTRNVTESRALPTSLMPEGLVDVLTDQELRDLLAYLTSRK